jgi:hypothetical protein
MALKEFLSGFEFWNLFGSWDLRFEIFEKGIAPFVRKAMPIKINWLTVEQ